MSWLRLRERCDTPPSVVDIDSLIDNASVRSDIDDDVLDSEIFRSSSAPPVVELTSANLFAFTADPSLQSQEWRLFPADESDVRLHPLWSEFASSYPNPEELPPDYLPDHHVSSLFESHASISRDSSTIPHLSPLARTSPPSDYSSSTYSTPGLYSAVPPVITQRPPIAPTPSVATPSRSSVLYPNTSFTEKDVGFSKFSPVSPKANAPMCRYFVSGNCRNGSNCQFSHDSPSSIKTSTSKSPVMAPISPRKTPPASPIKKPVQSIIAPPPVVVPVPCIQLFQADELLSLATDQQGCRFLQKLLDIAKAMLTQASALRTWKPYTDVVAEMKQCSLLRPEVDTEKLDELLEPFAIISQIFTEILPHFTTLCEDPFGNYLCQKIIEIVDENCRLEICKTCGHELYTKAQLMHGTRTVQKMVEFAGPKERTIIISSLANHVIPLIKDLNGNHVIQKCLQFFDPSENSFIFAALIVPSNLINVANSRNGACVLQRVLDFAPSSYQLGISMEIAKNCNALVYDQFGNYALQYVLDLAQKDRSLYPIYELIYSNVKGHIESLAKQKFASNVLEKFLDTAPTEFSFLIVAEIFENSQRILDLLIDGFGNFVIQKSLAILPPSLLNSYLEVIQPHMSFLRSKPFGSKIAARLIRNYPALRE
ncbi:hypothetical protein RCL1_001240 [Eukaryota sp. TZLM3-RCL]